MTHNEKQQQWCTSEQSCSSTNRQTRFERSSQYFLLLLQTDLICIVYASITTRAKQLMIFSASLLFQVGSPWRSSHLNELVWQTVTPRHVRGGFLAVSLTVWNKPGVPCIYVETAVNRTGLYIYIVTPGYIFPPWPEPGSCVDLLGCCHAPNSCKKMLFLKSLWSITMIDSVHYLLLSPGSWRFCGRSAVLTRLLQSGSKV